MIVLDSEVLLDDGSLVINVHNPMLCDGRPCVVHRPSNHRMRAWPMRWAPGRGGFERMCEHGYGHPDPDDMTYYVISGQAWRAQHGCDGCCWP